MTSRDEDRNRRRPRKLVKKRRQDDGLEYPKGLEIGEDVDEDVTAGPGPQPFHLNQSVFSLLAAAGSKTDLRSRYDDESSDSDNENETSQVPREALRANARLEQEEPSCSESPSRDHSEIFVRKRSDSKLLRSLPKLNAITPKEKNYMSQSMILPPKSEGSYTIRRGITPRDAPVMSQILEAQAQLEEPEDGTDNRGAVVAITENGEGQKKVTLAKRLMEIFNLDSEEEVVAEYPCWLMQSVLLQGFMYITSKHICFFSYLPKKSNTAEKSGYLGKRGKTNPTYKRHWYKLQGGVLSYYSDMSNQYFPNGTIDLRYGVAAAVSESTEKGKEGVFFTLTTSYRVYHFKADSAASAKEWVKTLQKVIFQAHNDGDSVKISLPVENVMDIEESQMVGFADTFRLRVIDNDETFAIDEYYFSFFSFGQDAFNVLKTLVDDSPASRLSVDLLSPNRIVSGQNSPLHDTQSPFSVTSPPTTIHETVKATLSPRIPSLSGRSSPRISGDWSRKSFDSRRSLELSREIKRNSSYNGDTFEDRGRRSASTEWTVPK
jgi:sterol 3beta-glucosyltransferase